MVESASYLALSANSAAYHTSSRPYWETSDGSQEAILSGQSYLTAAVAAVTDMSAAIDAFTWAEGLANATQDVSDDYTATGNTSVTGTDGSSTNLRANTYGSWTGGIVEYIFEIETSGSLSAIDIVQALLISDGDDNVVARAAIVDSSYERMAISVTPHASEDNKYLVDAVFAKTYTNGAEIPRCKVTRDFGGDYCDPTDYEKNVFIYLNAIRTDPTTYEATFDAIIAAFVPRGDNSLECNYAFNGETTELRTFSSKSSGVAAAKATVSGTTAVAALKWSPGLYISAQEHVADMKDKSAVTDAGSDESTPTSRGALYGEGTVYETNIINDYDEMFVIMHALIGDSDSGTARNTMLKDTYTQVGVAQSAHDVYTSLTTINYADDTYITAEPYASCTTEDAEEEEEETVDLISGAVSLSLGAAGLALAAALF
jgi:uncharacterized protein YkwD